MVEAHLATFTDRMDALTASTADPDTITSRTAHHLGTLLDHPEFLDPEHRQPAADHYRQHLVHVHPAGRYSIVSLVWRAGQATPIHDHRCWCVVGVLEGFERETRYQLFDLDGTDVLVAAGETVYKPGDICQLVPPDEDIHRVAHDGRDGLSISIHVYGTDIAAVGTSVNRVFNQPIRTDVPPRARRKSWRHAV